MLAPEMDPEPLPNTPLAAAIRGMRREIDRLIEEQKVLIARTSESLAAGPPSAWPSTAGASGPSTVALPPPSAKTRVARVAADPQATIAGPAPPETGAKLDMTRRLEELSRSLGQKLRPTTAPADNPPTGVGE